MNIKTFFVGRAIGLLLVLSLLGIIVGFFALNNYIYDKKQPTATGDYKDTEYVIENRRVTLAGNVKHFGNELFTDLNNDGRDDVVFLITEETGGSGTFFYVVAALQTEGGYVGSQAYFLGDRIAPQNINKGNGKIIVVNYAVRAPNESFTTPPSIGKSEWLILDPTSLQFGIVDKDFTGEADPSRMTLGMKTWNWVYALYNDGREVRPSKEGVFTLTFNADGTFSASTDCNGIGGEYSTTDGRIEFSNMMSTLMYCEGSQENEIRSILENSATFHFTSKGELVLGIKYDSGSAIFR